MCRYSCTHSVAAIKKSYVRFVVVFDMKILFYFVSLIQHVFTCLNTPLSSEAAQTTLPPHGGERAPSRGKRVKGLLAVKDLICRCKGKGHTRKGYVKEPKRSSENWGKIPALQRGGGAHSGLRRHWLTLSLSLLCEEIMPFRGGGLIQACAGTDWHYRYHCYVKK